MIDIFAITYNHTNVIINVILIGAFILNLIFAFTIIFMERRSAGMDHNKKQPVRMMDWLFC